MTVFGGGLPGGVKGLCAEIQLENRMGLADHQPAVVPDRFHWPEFGQFPALGIVQDF
jgi:hypothetical protein